VGLRAGLRLSSILLDTPRRTPIDGYNVFAFIKPILSPSVARDMVGVRGDDGSRYQWLCQFIRVAMNSVKIETLKRMCARAAYSILVVIAAS
jgi:hypothetical protein